MNSYIREISDSCRLNSLNIDTDRYQYKSENIIFFIPIYGEEELNTSWITFLKDFSTNKSNIGINVFIYLFGVYDLEIHNSSTIIKQIKYYTRFLSSNIHIYPLKLAQDRINIDDMIYFYSHNLVFNHKIKPFDNMIKNIIFDTKSNLLVHDNFLVDFTRKEDGFSSILSRLSTKDKLYYLENIFTLCRSEKLILDRIGIDMINFKIANKNIKHLSMKSSTLKDIPPLDNIPYLQVINLTANYIEKLDIKRLPENIYFINLSKNRIKTLQINSNKHLKLKRLSLFNNKLQNLKGIEYLSNLNYLNIGFNSFKVFPDELKYLSSLTHLNISFTEIMEIPEYILEWEQLEILDITGCKYLKNDKTVTMLKNNRITVIY